MGTRFYSGTVRGLAPRQHGQQCQTGTSPGKAPSHGRQRIQSVEDKLVLFIGNRDGEIYAATFDENSAEPVAAGSFSNTGDKIALGDKIAAAFFDGHTTRRLSKAERAKRMTEPDESYKEIPGFQGWAGIAVGYSQAQIPLTPDNWYSSHTRSRVRNYRITKDSASLWNFIEDSDPQMALYAGGTWYGFIGAELMYRYAYHKVKTDDQDTIYQELVTGDSTNTKSAST
jgi:hypothetical protein